MAFSGTLLAKMSLSGGPKETDISRETMPADGSNFSKYRWTGISAHPRLKAAFPRCPTQPISHYPAWQRVRITVHFVPTRSTNVD